MGEVWLFGATWTAILGVVTLMKIPSRIRTVTALLTNWAIGLVFFWITGLHTAWWFVLPLDTITAWFVLRQPAGKLQGGIALLLLVQVAFHCSYGIVEIFNSYSWYAEIKYWRWLRFVATLQIMFVGGGVGGGIVLRACRHLLPWHRSLARPARISRVEG